MLILSPVSGFGAFDCQSSSILLNASEICQRLAMPRMGAGVDLHEDQPRRGKETPTADETVEVEMAARNV